MNLNWFLFSSSRECLCGVCHFSADAHYQCHDGVWSHYCECCRVLLTSHFSATWMLFVMHLMHFLATSLGAGCHFSLPQLFFVAWIQEYTRHYVQYCHNNISHTAGHWSQLGKKKKTDKGRETKCPEDTREMLDK